MTVTLRLSDILLIVITISVAGLAIYMMAALKRVTTAMAELEKVLGKAGKVLPEIEATAVQARETLGAVQHLAEEGQRVVGDVAEVAAVARTVAEEGAEQVRGVLAAVGQVGAVIKGFQSGLDLFCKGREPAEEEDRDQEE